MAARNRLDDSATLLADLRSDVRALADAEAARLAEERLQAAEEEARRIAAEADRLCAEMEARVAAEALRRRLAAEGREARPAPATPAIAPASSPAPQGIGGPAMLEPVVPERNRTGFLFAVVGVPVLCLAAIAVALILRPEPPAPAPPPVRPVVVNVEPPLAASVTVVRPVESATPAPVSTAEPAAVAATPQPRGPRTPRPPRPRLPPRPASAPLTVDPDAF